MIYPTSIREPLVKRIEELGKDEWFSKPDLPGTETFQQFLDVAFHASLMTEEKRRPGFRLLYCYPDDLNDFLGDQFRTTSRIVRMPSPLPYTANELNRIAPAADLTRFLICVCTEKKESNSLQIWGLLDVGDNWWKFIHHETSGGKVPPNFPAITSTSPGELSFSVAGHILLTLKNGELFYPSRSLISSGPISDFLDPSRQCLYDQTIQELKTEKWDDNEIEDNYPHRFYDFFMERLLYNIRYQGHGATVILVPDEIGSDDQRLKERILLKYPTTYDHAWGALVRSLVNHRRYYDLYFSLAGIEIEGQKSRLRKKFTEQTFRQFNHLSNEKDDIDEEIRDIAKSIASLAGVDGALVISTKFEVLGFGGEITITSNLDSVVSASDKKRIPIESFGTRHRSAFRFCSNYEHSVACIVSSDGGVKATKRHGPELLFWPDINEGAMGL